jgi:hypothetical protein
MGTSTSTTLRGPCLLRGSLWCALALSNVLGSRQAIGRQPHVFRATPTPGLSRYYSLSLAPAWGWQLESSVGIFRLAARLANSYPEISGMFTSMIARSKPAVSIACKARLPSAPTSPWRKVQSQGRQSEEHRCRIVLSHQYRGRGFHQIGAWMVCRSDQSTKSCCA